MICSRKKSLVKQLKNQTKKRNNCLKKNRIHKMKSKIMSSKINMKKTLFKINKLFKKQLKNKRLFSQHKRVLLMNRRHT